MPDAIRFIQNGEPFVGEGHPTLDDTLNRGAKDILSGSGLDPADPFHGFASKPEYDAAIQDLQAQIDSEASTRSDGDTTLQTNIDAEATARASAVSTEFAARLAGDTGSSVAWGQDPAATTGLTYGYRAGRAWNSSGVLQLIAADTVALTDDATNYVERTLAGVVSVNQTGFTASKIPMAVVVTVAGAITSVTDWRFSELGYYPPVTGEVSPTDLRYPVGDILRYGAVGDGVTDDTTAWENWNASIAAVQVREARCIGTFLVSGHIHIGPASGQIATKVIKFNAIVNSGFASQDYVLQFRGCSGIKGVGYLEVNGYSPGGFSTYTNRQNWVGVLIGDGAGAGSACDRMKLPHIKVNGFAMIGFSLDGGVNSNTSMMEMLSASQCGSGKDGGNMVSSNFTANTQSGNSRNTNQRSTLTVDSVPATLAVSDLAIINGNPHIVTSIDTGAGTVGLFPWVATATTTGVVEWVIGAALYVVGSDSNIWTLGVLEVKTSAQAYKSRETYPWVIQTMQVQQSLIGLTLGGFNHSSLGGAIIQAYFESNNTLEIIQTTAVTTGSTPSFVIDTAGTGTPSKWFNLRSNDGTSYGGTNGNPMGIRIQKGSHLHGPTTAATDLDSSTQSITLLPRPASMRTHKRDTLTVNLSAAADVDLARLFGYDVTCVIAHGTGSSGQPTGTWTFQPSDVGYTVNGGATAPFTMTAPTFFICKLAFGSTDWIVTPVGFASGGIAHGLYLSAEYPGTVNNVSGAVTIDWSKGNFQYVTLTGDTTFTFINPQPGMRCTLFIAYAGAYTPTLPASVRYADGGITPAWTSTNGKKDIASVLYSGVESLYSVAVTLNLATT